MLLPPRLAIPATPPRPALYASDSTGNALDFHLATEMASPGRSGGELSAEDAEGAEDEPERLTPVRLPRIQSPHASFLDISSSRISRTVRATMTFRVCGSTLRFRGGRSQVVDAVVGELAKRIEAVAAVDDPRVQQRRRRLARLGSWLASACCAGISGFFDMTCGGYRRAARASSRQSLQAGVTATSGFATIGVEYRVRVDVSRAGRSRVIPLADSA